MSAESDDSIENIDFGGRFARQFFNNNCPKLDSDILNPITSTPVASDNSFCESGYESFNQAYRLIDINNNTSKSNVISNRHDLVSHSNNGSDVSNCSNNNSNQDAHNDLIRSQQYAANHHEPSINVDIIQRQQRSNSLFTTAPAVASILNAKNPWSSQALQDVYQRFNDPDKIERAASLHRTAASFSEPQYTWSGQLPSRSYKNPVYSCKVFLGGVPWDITEHGLIETFGRFGHLRVQWPPLKESRRQQNKDNRRQSGKDNRQQPDQMKAGYVYIIYESERSVKALLQACTQDYGFGSHPEKYFYQLASRKFKYKDVQVVPWILADSNYTRSQSGRPDTHRTVFVGALHGMLTAEGLAKIMDDLFDGVAYVGIDSDKYKYPIGSGRVIFNNLKSYMKAVSAAFIEVKSSRFSKIIQVDPYLEPSTCSTCHVQNGPYFCRDCLRYFCKTCWNWRHATESIIGRLHCPMIRKKRET